MRIKRFLLLAFFLSLYIAPSILCMSSTHVAIVAERNMSKDFSPSAYGDISPQSITSFSEETVWYFDCSNDTNVSPTAGDTATSDGDILTLDSDATVGSFNFSIFYGATGYSCAAYPFLVVNVTSVSGGDGWKLEQFDGTAWAQLSTATEPPGTYTTTTGIYRYNTRALDTSVYKFRVNVTATALIDFGFLRAYTIADFTVTQGGSTAVSSVAYVSGDTLYMTQSGGNYFTFNHDPAISVSQATYSDWNITTSNLGAAFVLGLYNGSWNTFTDEDTRGAMPIGTTTDFYFQSYAPCNIAGIKFIQTSDWFDVGEAPVIVNVAMSEATAWALNNWYILLGMGLVVFSGVYLVKGGRSEASMNKVFYAIIAFMIGWALVIGGIMP